MPSPFRVIVIGGVAGGASAAARARRLSESAQILLVERGPHVSFANCGLPYHVGGEIEREQDLLVQTPQSLMARFNMQIRLNTEAISIDRAARTVTLRSAAGTAVERYDALILATGAAPLRPPIPGIDRPGLFTLRSIPDMQAIIGWIDSRSARRAVVVGGGYIGLEMAEQLHRRGLEVSIAEALPQVMAPLDPEVAEILHTELRANGVALHLGDGVARFEEPAAGEDAAAATVVLKSGARLPADIVILGMGVRPDVALAKGAGLALGVLGGIRVDETMQASDPSIWAVGDAVEVRNAVTGEWSLIPLAGPANRQGRTAADNVFGRRSTFKGTWGACVLRVFSLAAGAVGANAKILQRTGAPHQAIYLHPGSHAGYFPGAAPLAIKVLYNPEDGKLLGAQVVGKDGADKRIDVFSTALQAGMTIDDLANLELSYAPPFGSAKDPVNLAGMVGQNVRGGLVELAQWSELETRDPEATLLLDVRGPAELEEDGAIPGAVHIPLPQLRMRLGELPRDREIIAYCWSGQRSYVACRILSQNGFRCRNLTGAFKTWAIAQGRTV